ncbi:DUF4347 domain-containing protein, partial [Microcoleus sp.]|uniref:DUF4347 domain-containing protein n=1 Tax=Microcoleus sp. TaxID=44472 RepID=UPI003525720A
MNLPTPNQQIIFVDSSVQDYQSLIQNIDRAQIFILNENLSAIEQITHALANQKDIEGVHIVSHGSDGTLFLGNSLLNETTLETHAATVKQWGKALKLNADILLYGCNVAQTEQGKAFVKRLSELTKANVAASTTPTGNAKLGGDWNLEFIIGKIKAALAFSPAVTAAYSGILGNGPGGIDIVTGTPLQVWLKANTIAGANGSAVTNWADSSGVGNNATGTGATLVTNEINGQSVVKFDGTNVYSVGGAISNPYTLLTVSKQDGLSRNRLISSYSTGPTNWLLGYWALGAPVGEDQFYANGWVYNNPNNIPFTGNPIIYSATGTGSLSTFYRNGSSLAANNSGITAPGQLALGGTNFTGIFNEQSDGKVAEVIAFNRVLNDAERTLADNYLSAKYNINLTTGDYYVGDNGGSDYDWNVAGIGKEANGSNTNGNTTSGLIINNGTFLQDNGDYLIAGQIETANATNVTTDLPSATGINRLSRVWYLDKTDVNTNGGTANLTFDFSDSGLGGTPTGKYHLLYRSGSTVNFAYVNNATFTTNITFTITGDQVTFNNVEIGLLNDGYYTLASKNNDVPLLDNIANPAAINENATEQTITLTGISDLETATNALTLATTSDNAALTGTPTITNNNNGTATLKYTPIADANGTANISVTITDADAGTVTKSFAVNVNAVNDKPSFTNLGNQTLTAWTNTVQTVSNWVNSRSFGPANESTQTVLNYPITNNNNTLFTTQPSVATNGTLTYTPSGKPGTATVTVQLQDSGGTANSGVDLSNTATFNITIPAPKVNLTASTNTASEAAQTAITFTATAEGNVVGAQTVNAKLTGTASDADFTGAIPVQITIPNGSKTGQVTLTVSNDNLVEGTETATLTISNPSSGILLGTTTNQSVTILDSAGITITPAAGLTTTEAGGKATFTVKLNTQPTADVKLGLTSNKTTEGTVDKSSITFTSANWNVAQTVTVTGVDDLIADGNQAYQIITAADTTTTDLNYKNLKPADVAVTNIDNETAGITVSPTTGLTTTEAGGTATFTVKLNTQPTADVKLGLTSNKTTEGTVDKSSVTFTPANWNVAQTVTVTGVDDLIADGNQAYQIITAADTTTTDLNYKNLKPADVAVTNIDNETAGITVSPTTGLTTTE